MGRVTRLFYDQYQRPERTQRPDGTSVGRSYNAQGEVAWHYNGAGARTHYFYDPMHRIAEIRHPGDPNAERFQYDNKGRLSAWVRASGTVSYIYDRLDRIDQIRFNGQTQIDYNYDILGRLEQMSDTIGVTRYQYSPGSDLLRVTDSFNRSIDYQYDLANQLLRRTDPQGLAMTFAYNERGQVRSASHDGLTSNYEYNALGAPTRVTWQNGLTEAYQYSSQGEAMERSVSFFLGATGRQAIKVDGQWHIYLRDTHGSMTGLVDLAGNRVATYENTDYGEVLVDEGSVYNPYRWNGEPLDSESGLTYMRNRYYHPSTGRFIQRDPIGYAGGLNLYSFAAGDPINLADPDGLIPQAIVDEVRGTSPNQGASSEAILGTAAAMIPGVDEATTAYNISKNGLQWYHGAAFCPSPGGTGKSAQSSGQIQ